MRAIALLVEDPSTANHAVLGLTHQLRQTGLRVSGSRNLDDDGQIGYNDIVVLSDQIGYNEYVAMTDPLAIMNMLR